MPRPLVCAVTLAGGNYLSQLLLISLVTAFGVISLPIYSLVVAHANDHLEKDQVLGASAKLVLLYGVGSIIGPILRAPSCAASAVKASSST